MVEIIFAHRSLPLLWSVPPTSTVLLLPWVIPPTIHSLERQAVLPVDFL